MSTEKSSPSTPVASLGAVIIAVSSAQFMLPFMLSGAGPILPAIGRDLNASAMELSLINAVYTLSLAIFNLLAGRVGDILGRKRLFMIGLGTFIGMSLIIPFCPNMLLFLACRFLQAMGTAIMSTCSLAILVTCAPANQLGKVLGISSIGMYVGLSLGPGLSGLVATAFGWQYLFFAMVPVGIAAWILLGSTIKGDWKSTPDEPFDWFGSVLYFIAICGVSIGSIWLLQGTWAVVCLGVGIFFLICFLRSEWRSKHPLLDVRFIIHNVHFALSMLAAFINYSSIFGVTFYFSLYLQGVKGLSVLETGTLLTLQPMMQAIMSPVGGRMGDRHGADRVATLGIGLCGISLLGAALLGGDSSLWLVGGILILLGTGVGLFASPNTSAIMSGVDSAHMGLASGMVGTARTMGMLLSMVIISLTMNAFLGDSALGAENASHFLEAMHINFLLFGAMNILGIFCSFGRVRAGKRAKKNTR